MQWKNPDGSITEGVVIEDGNGNKITSFSGGGGGTVTQGSAGSAAEPWYVAPGTGVTWTLGGALPAFAATPTFNIGTAPTLAVNWSGQSVAATQSGTWNIGSVASLPALPAGSNTVGNVGVNNNPVGSAAFAASQASIGTAAAQIVAARGGVAGTGRIAVTLYNAGSATVYFGASGVTTTTGMPLPAGASATVNTQAAIYGIAASGTQTIGVMETF
ncbi:MAG TPA: hypothetical protein VIF61_07320 [Methylocystis sp.]